MAALYLHTAINQGDKVAIQSYNRRYWLSCVPNPCQSRYTCPGLIMTSTDWTNCGGEVFQIYRARGPGEVRVGDAVGLYYPIQPGKWLGCNSPSGNCGKYTCPGTPTTTYGFQDGQRWISCGGEVFKIYAAGKADGSIINQHDTIMLYYVGASQWVNLENNVVARGSCPGTTRPPSVSTYKSCWGYGTEIWSP